MMENALLRSADHGPFNGQMLLFVKNKTSLCLWSRLNHLQLPASGCSWGLGCSAEKPSHVSLLGAGGLQLNCLCPWCSPGRAAPCSPCGSSLNHLQFINTLPDIKLPEKDPLF